LLLSLSMAWSPPARQRRSWLVEQAGDYAAQISHHTRDGTRADVVGIFPSEASIIRLIGAVLLEANDEWQMQHRYTGVEAMGEMLSRRPPTKPCNCHPGPPEPWPFTAHQQIPPH
jgi:Transposase, Mutator family